MRSRDFSLQFAMLEDDLTAIPRVFFQTVKRLKGESWLLWRVLFTVSSNLNEKKKLYSNDQ